MTDGRDEPVFRGVGVILDDVEELYKDLHGHPELSMEEKRTAALAAERLRSTGFEVTTDVGQTGVVGLLRNGDGPTVMLRADMDALPVQEQTGVDYASAVDGVMHACGHDMHVAWLVGATAVLSAAHDQWSGTLMAVFQPAEETAAGARAMVDDGLLEKFPKPEVILGQHVMPAPAGSIGIRPGVTTSAADSIEIRMFGRGAHGSMPQASVDRYDLVRNDPDAAERVRRAFERRFGHQRVATIPPLSASEVPTNHNPRFAPVLHPTLETGVETLLAAAGAWLATPGGNGSSANQRAAT